MDAFLLGHILDKKGLLPHFFAKFFIVTTVLNELNLFYPPEFIPVQRSNKQWAVRWMRDKSTGFQIQASELILSCTPDVQFELTDSIQIPYWGIGN